MTVWVIGDWSSRDHATMNCLGLGDEYTWCYKSTNCRVSRPLNDPMQFWVWDSSPAITQCVSARIHNRLLDSLPWYYELTMPIQTQNCSMSHPKRLQCDNDWQLVWPTDHNVLDHLVCKVPVESVDGIKHECNWAIAFYQLALQKKGVVIAKTLYSYIEPLPRLAEADHRP